MKMILDLFAGGHSVTVLKDAHISAASASATSDVQAEAEVTLTVTAASNYEIAEYEVLEGGVTVNPATKKFTMGSENVTIIVRSKKANNYMVTEETSVCVNGSKTALHKNTVVQVTANGVPTGVTVENGGTVISASDAVNYLIAQGILVKN